MEEQKESSKMRTLQGSCILLHGPPKIGKTQLASKFPGPVLFIATEPGHKYLPSDQRKIMLKIDPENGWKKFKDQAVNYVHKYEPKTLVIDTIAGLYSACMAGVCKENRWRHPEDGAHGKGWAEVKRALYTELTKLAFACTDNNITSIWIAHTKEEEVVTPTQKQTKLTVALPGMARSVIMPVPDHVWFLGYAENSEVAALTNFQKNRALWIRGTEVVEAGCRDPKCIVSRIKPLHEKDPYKQIIEKINQTK